MPDKDGCRELSPRECSDLLSRNLERPCRILDVRTADEFRGGHVIGAEHLDFYRPDFRQCIEQKDRTIRYLVYCRRGIRGQKTMELMHQCGFPDVVNIRGGYENWVSQGLPVQND